MFPLREQDLGRVLRNRFDRADAVLRMPHTHPDVERLNCHGANLTPPPPPGNCKLAGPAKAQRRLISSLNKSFCSRVEVAYCNNETILPRTMSTASNRPTSL